MKICPRCSKEYEGYPAISRRDNKTKICSSCGGAEALFDLGIAKDMTKESEWLNKGKEVKE